MDASRNYPLELPNNIELHYFIDDPNFDQFIDLIPGENEDVVAGLDYDLVNGCFVDKQISSTPDGDAFGFDATSVMVPDASYIFNNALSSFDGEIMKDAEEDNDGEENSSGTTTTTKTTTTTTTATATKKAKVDRSRTLISERRRRGRMKEKLYALRSLVPNITKMDKASIIGDAVLYVQDLQIQAKKLKAEIAGLEASLAGSERYLEPIDNPVKIRVARNSHPICKKILQLNMFQVEERGFYIRLVCNKGEGVAVSLYKALESLTNFKAQNSNLATVSDRFSFTFTLNVRDCEQSMNLPNLKLWVTGALLNQGFEFITPLSS
ncbi:transcription factor FER-LIKE IRON DEFICIENCY-INDUCED TRANSCRIPTION FACTOR-like [Durio zibethinus]|uniref:Transcription factor FER-LIKE IRON DEFICIENCY-INDUCED TRANSCRIPTION FACTOR-like n=1 Tax=Durio zibethinus TaxID=66656 RepID=A0A6P5ZLL2_DURZI|nr:transcription factor FER-LIKE IRON DEFICIENCY-INDUCED TRANSCRIPTION FACTOR-like [Durio zibethinus]